MNFKKIMAGALPFLGAMVLATTAWASHVAWDQGFETNTDGWLDSDDAWYGDVTRVASGTDGITSSLGSWHAIFSGDESSGPFSRFDGYKDTWPGTWIAELDVYLDPSWADGTGFDYSVAANGSDDKHQRDYIFHVTKDSSDSKLYVGGSNNTNFAPREDLESLNHYEVVNSGWYTLQHVFRDELGSLAVDLNLLDSDGNVLFTETRYNVADTIPAEVGGNRYAWFTFINVDSGIAVDNHQLILLDYFERTAEITSPAEDEKVYGLVSFDAMLHDKDMDDSVQWAVRKGTCNASQGTVFGNVDGFNDLSSWDGENFHAEDDVSNWDPGMYCFVFNPTESDGDEPIRLTRWFEVVPTTTPVQANECKKGGWMNFNTPSFKNQGDCVSWLKSSPMAIGNKKNN